MPRCLLNPQNLAAKLESPKMTDINLYLSTVITCMDLESMYTHLLSTQPTSCGILLTIATACFSNLDIPLILYTIIYYLVTEIQFYYYFLIYFLLKYTA